MARLSRAFVAFALLFTLPACNPVDKANEVLMSMQGDLQARRALTLSEADANAMSRTDIILGVRAEVLQRLAPRIVNDLNATKSAREHRLNFLSARFVFGEQILGAEIVLKQRILEADVTIKALASSYVGSTNGQLALNLYLDGFEVLQIEGIPWFGYAAARAIGHGINALRAPISAVFDEFWSDEEEKAVLLSLDKKNLVSKQLRDRRRSQKPDQFDFDAKILEAAMVSRRAAVLIERRGIVVVAEVDFVDPDKLAPLKRVFPKDTELVRQSTDGLDARLANYKQRVLALADALGPEAANVQRLEASGLAVSRGALARLIAFLATQGNISGTLRIRKPVEQKADLTFKIGQQDCRRKIDGCSFKNRCEGDRCKRTITRQVGAVCRFACRVPIFGFAGAIIGHVTKVCNRPCNRIETAVEDIADQSCDAFRATDRLYQGRLCNIASNVDKAFCDVEHNLRKSACDVEQELARFYQSNPIATVKSRIEPRLELELAAHDVVVAPDLTRIGGIINVTGGGQIRTSIAYDRRNYADGMVIPREVSLGLACHTDWKESIETSATLQPASKQLSFSLDLRNLDEGGIELEYNQAKEEIVQSDFSPAPLVALFGGKPQVAINCPLAAVGAIVFGAYEAVFTQENARKVLPLLTGKGFPIELKDLSFSIKIKPMRICKERKGQCEQNPLLVLKPTLSATSLLLLAQ